MRHTHSTPSRDGTATAGPTGTIPDLSALSGLRTINGPLILYGVDGQSALPSLAGLETLQVRAPAR